MQTAPPPVSGAQQLERQSRSNKQSAAHDALVSVESS